MHLSLKIEREGSVEFIEKEFKKISDVIVLNRLSDDLEDVKEKIYTRDLFTRD